MPAPGPRHLPARAARSASAWLADRSGNLAIGVMLGLVPIMLGVGAALDATNITRTKSDVQMALDAASMQIAVAVNSGRSHQELEALGKDFLLANLDAPYRDDVLSFTYLGISTAPDGTQTLSTSLTQAYDYLIPRSIGGDATPSSTTLQLASTITSSSGDRACVYALDHTAPRAIEAAGNTSIVMDGCILASNSNAADAIYVGGSATLSADCLQSSGGIDATGGLTVDCEQNRMNAWRLPDPFATLVEPMPPATWGTVTSTTATAGRFSNLKLNGTQVLGPGLYYIEGDLTIKGDISGTDVTFFLADGSVTVNGNASLSLSAPETGDYAGMLFMAARSNTSDHIFNGTGATDLNGFLYFPAGHLTYTGNNTTTSTCMRIVADTVLLSGSSNLRSDCTEELGGRQARVAGPLYYSR